MFFWKTKKKPSPLIDHINANFHPDENIKRPPISKEMEVDDLKYHMIIRQHLLDLGANESDCLWEILDKYLTELKELRNGRNLQRPSK